MLGKTNTDKHKIDRIMLTPRELFIKSSTEETVYPTLNSKPLDPNVLKLDLTLEKFNEEFCNNGQVILTPIKVEYMSRRATCRVVLRVTELCVFTLPVSVT